ncbi:unnamed protein product [Leuciscus chuanchicus]
MTGSSLISHLVLPVLFTTGLLLQFLCKKRQSRGAQPSTSAAALSQECPQTPTQEPTPATDVLKTEPMVDYAQPSTSAAVLSERNPSSSPRDGPVQINPTGMDHSSRDVFDYGYIPEGMDCSSDVFEYEYIPEGMDSISRDAFNYGYIPEGMDSSSSTDASAQNNPTEKHTKGREGRSLWAAVKCGIQAFVSEVFPSVFDREPSQEHPQTPEEEPTDLTLIFPDEPTAQDIYFQYLYEVGKRVRHVGRVHEGIRRSDGQKPEFIEEGTTYLEMQKDSTCDHFMRLYDRFILEDQNILIMEPLSDYVTWSEFIRRKGGRLTEETADHIMAQMLVAEDHCIDKDLLYLCLKRFLLINPKTMHIKYAHVTEKDLKRFDNTKDEDIISECCFLFVMHFQSEGELVGKIDNNEVEITLLGKHIKL